MARYPHQEDVSTPKYIDLNNASLLGVGDYRGERGSDLLVSAMQELTDSTASLIRLFTLDPAGDARVEVAEAVPTATPTTPYWAQRADVTTPINPTLPASFLTFKWNPATDVVSVYVNDGGTIRTVAIGTVV